jgi:hypothetical protein
MMNRNNILFEHVKRYAFIVLFGFFQIVIHGQNNKEVVGLVVDESGMPVPGVTVLVKGTTVGTTTDFDGRFSLNVTTPKAVIVFSYIGYVSVEKPASESPFNIDLKEDVQ